MFNTTAIKTDLDVTVDNNLTVTKTLNLDGYVIDPRNASNGRTLTMTYDNSTSKWYPSY